MGRVLMPNNSLTMDTSAQIEGVIEKYRINSDDLVHDGHFIKFTTKTASMAKTQLVNYTTETKIIQIDKHRALAIYTNENNTNIVGSVVHIYQDGIRVSEASTIHTSSAGIHSINVAKLNFYTYLISYIDVATGFGHIIAIKVINDAISVISSLAVTTAVISELVIADISDTSAAIAYITTSNQRITTTTVLLHGSSLSLSAIASIPQEGATGLRITSNRDTYEAVITYRYSTVLYVRKIKFGATSTYQSIALTQSLTSTDIYCGAIYLNDNQIIVPTKTNIYRLTASATDFSIIENKPVSLTTLSLNGCKVRDNCVLFGSDNNGVNGVYVIDTVQDKLNMEFCELPNQSFQNGVVLSPSSAVILSTDQTDMGTYAISLAVSDIGIEESTTQFTTEGIAAGNGNGGDIIPIKTKQDTIGTVIGAYKSNNDDNLSIGDFVDFINTYTEKHYDEGNEYEISDSHASLTNFTNITAHAIDNERALLTYINIESGSTTRRAAMRIVKVSGTEITMGNQVYMNPFSSASSGTEWSDTVFDALVLDDSKIVAAYGMNTGNTYYSRENGSHAVLFTYGGVDGLTLTRITETTHQYLATRAEYMKLHKISATSVVILSAYSVFELTISGGVLSSRVRSSGDSYPIIHAEMQTISNNRIVAIYARRYATNSVSIMYRVITTNGSSITAMTSDSTIMTQVYENFAFRMSEGLDAGIIAFANSSANNYIVYPVTMSGQYVSFGTSNVKTYSTTSRITDISMTRVLNNKFLLAYSTDAGINYRIMYLNATNQIVAGEIFTDGHAGQLALVQMDDFKAILAYATYNSDDQSTYVVKARTIGTSGDIPTLTLDELNVDDTSLVKSVTTYGSDGLIMSDNDNMYMIRDMTPVIERFTSQKIITGTAADILYSGDMVNITETATGYTIRLATPTNVNGITTASANVGDLITVRTLYK